LGGRDEMIKASIDLQDLRRKIYLKVKAELAGTGGVRPWKGLKALPVR
jgi:hypothetical protein